MLKVISLNRSTGLTKRGFSQIMGVRSNRPDEHMCVIKWVFILEECAKLKRHEVASRQ